MHRTASIGLLFIVAALTSPAVQALGITFDHTFRTEAEAAAVSTWARGALSRLPPSLHDRLPGELRVRFRRWGDDLTPLAEPQCARGGSPEARPVYTRYGRFNRLTGVISINSRLLKEVMAGPSASRRIDCYHGDFYSLATATLLHEIAHAYDALDFDGGPAWARVAGFDSRFLGFYTGRNRDLDRLPSPQGAANAAEAFAVHFEYFLLDPEYRCRFPSHHEYFENHFSWAPRSGDCLRSYEIVAGQGTRLIELDPDRIYQLRYLLASPGQKARSKFGHSMLHIVMCAPDTPPGPECLAQEEEHMVLGFVAFTDDSILRTVNGVIGIYDSSLVFSSLQDQLRKYNDRQLRDMRSYPLDLDRAQIRRLIHRALEMYWTYRGPYRFLTNNCATELEDLLKAGILHDDYLGGRARTPRGVLKGLIGAGQVGDDEVLVYESDFDEIVGAAASLYDAPRMRGPRSVNRWIESLSYEQRSVTLDALNAELKNLQESMRNDASVDATMAALLDLGKRLESFRLLETSVLVRQEAALEGLQQRERNRFARDDGGRQALLEHLRALANSLLYGDRDRTPGYGIPLIGESQPDLADLGRQFDTAVSQVAAWQAGPAVGELEQRLAQTRSLSASRYDTLMAYADFTRDLRSAVVKQAVIEHPRQTNSQIRVLLEQRFGGGSFEPTRVSDTRFDRIRQSTTAVLSQ